MTYDDWKTTPPDDYSDECGCVFVINQGIRFCVERCEEHQRIYEENEQRLAEKRAQEKKDNGEEDGSDDIPF